MKKILLIIALVFAFGVTNAYAISESELYSKLTEEHKVNGVTFKANDAQKNLIKQYLDQYEVSSSDADYIVTKLEETFNILKNSGKKSFYDLSSTDKNKIISIAANVSTNTSLDCAIVDGEFIVYVPGTNKGEVFYASSVNPIAQTDSSSTLIIAGLGIVSLLGIGLALHKVKNA